MSSLPSSKSSFRRATQGCCALMLAGAMVLPMTPVLAQDTAPVTNISVPNAPVANTASPVSQDVTDGPSFTIDYGEGAALYTDEYNEITVRGTGLTKEWRKQHGEAVLYIAATKDRPGNTNPSTSVLFFGEGWRFPIADDGTFEAKLRIRYGDLDTFYDPIRYDAPNFRWEEVRYEIGILTVPEGQPWPTIEDIWARKNVAIHQPIYARRHPKIIGTHWRYDALKDTAKDQEVMIEGEGFSANELPGREGVMYTIREKGTGTPVLLMSEMERYYDRGNGTLQLWGNAVYKTIKIPANTLDPSKQYVLEAWSDYGYVSQTDKTLITPLVGLAPEHRGVLMGRQDLKFEGLEEFTDVSLPKPKYKHLFSKLSDEEQQQRATRGELAAALYLQAGAPKVNLPAASPWPDVKTDDPNYAAYIWVREKGISFGWSDGKFHADAGISRATVAAFTYRAAGSPAVSGVSSFTDVNPSSAFYREILWSAQHGVINPQRGIFEATTMVNRGELEQMMFIFQNRTDYGGLVLV